MTRNYSTTAVIVAFVLFLLGALAAIVLQFPKPGYYGLLLFVSTLVVALVFELTNDALSFGGRSVLSSLAVLSYSAGVILILTSAAARFVSAARALQHLTTTGLSLFVAGLALQILSSGIGGIRVSLQQGRTGIAVLKGATVLIVCGLLSCYVVKLLH